jgi:hypothetical protein
LVEAINSLIPLPSAKMAARPQALRSSSNVIATKTLVLISGGNAGIGYEIVKKIATEHPSTHHVLMGCRDTHKGEAAVAVDRCQA